MPLGQAQQMHHIAPVKYQRRHERPLNRRQRQKPRLRLQEIDRQPPRQVPRQEQPEQIARPMRTLRQPPDCKRQHSHRRDLIKLCRMPPHPIAEIDAPRQPRRPTVSVIAHPREEAAHPPNRDPRHNRQREQIARPAFTPDSREAAA